MTYYEIMFCDLILIQRKDISVKRPQRPLPYIKAEVKWIENS